MPRSAKEWFRARDEWNMNNRMKISAIDPPDSDSIVYKRQSTNFYWQKRWKDVKNLVPTHINFTFRNQYIEKYIRSAANFEHTKEQDFLNKFYKGKRKGESEIDMFNNLFQSRELYMKFNERIKDILENKQYQENADQSRHKYYRGMAPNLASVFTSYLSKHLNDVISEWWSTFNPAEDMSSLALKFEEKLKEAAIRASQEMVEITPERANEYGSGEEWQPVLDMLQGTGAQAELQQSLFMDNLREAIGSKRINMLLHEMKDQKAAGRKKSLTKKDIVNTLKLSQKARIGGSILEPVLAAMANAINGASNNDFRMWAGNFGGNARMTDVFMLFSTNMELDLSALGMDLEKATRDGLTTEMREVYQKIQNWYIDQNWEGNLQDLYAVYVNAKNYGLGESGSDYTKEYNGKLEELPYFLQSNGIDIESASEFLRFVYNTAEGAINDGKQTVAWRYSINALKAAAAKIMFDDYQSIGQGDENAIHMYYLSGKYLPASYVLNAMADAAAEQNINADAQVSLPDPIKDQGPEWGNLPHDSDLEFKTALRAYWDTESERIKSTGNWSLSFTLKIKDLLAGSY